MLAEYLGPYALGVVVVFAVVVLVVVVKVGRSVTLGWRDMQIKVGAVHGKVESIDKQVNQVAATDPTLRNVIVAMHSQMAEARADLALVKQAAAEAAVHSAEARRVARTAAESTKANNVLLTRHIADCESRTSRGD